MSQYDVLLLLLLSFLFYFSFYVEVFLAQMILGSLPLLHKFPLLTLQKMVFFFKSIGNTNFLEIQTYEIQMKVVWGSFQHLFYLYESKSLCLNDLSEATAESIRNLWKMSTNVILVSLQSTLGRKDHRETILKEDLVDYIVMIPWNVPKEHHDLATSVVQEFAKICRIEPPSLSALSKAKLGKSTIGLKKVIDCNSLTQLLCHLNLS